MVIICGRGFDKAYCAPGCAGFITQFLSAWIESLVYEHHLNDNTFAEREKFLQLWKFSLFDLTTSPGMNRRTTRRELRTL
jgi:hypothetical protein